ncbi:ABC transporter permease subunit, partial [Rhizobiaceae sp. 2RAB30]
VLYDGRAIAGRADWRALRRSVQYVFQDPFTALCPTMRIGQALAEPLAMLYTEGAVIVAMVYLFVPLMILTLVGVLENIPEDVVQASASLGATPAATFRQVILPLAVPGLIVGAVLVFTGSFTAYATPQLLGGERQMVMGTLMYQRAMVSFDWVGASTIAAVMVVITIATVLVMSRIARRLNPMAT